MPTTLEKEIERALEAKLTQAVVPLPARPRHPARPVVVRFSPMFTEPPVAAKKRRRTLIAMSIATHVVVVGVVLLMPRRAQTIEDPSLPIAITFAAPVPEIREPARPRAVPKPPPPKPKREPVIRDEPPPVVAPPKPVVPEVVAPPVAKPAPPRAKPVVKTGLLDEAPSGPAIVASKTSRSVVTMSGFDGAAGSASSPARPGRVVEAGFEDAPVKAKGKRAGSAGVVASTGFSEEAAPTPKRSAPPERTVSPLDSEVEILSKPKPVYTDEARERRIEGDVVLDVIFGANGVLRVLGVASGLGHGLDQAAIDAAKKIRFNPAKRDGTAVDHTAKLRVVFRLA